MVLVMWGQTHSLHYQYQLDDQALKLPRSQLCETVEQTVSEMQDITLDGLSRSLSYL